MAQETFFKIIDRLDEYRGDGKFYVWVCSIAKNAYYDHLRERTRTVPCSQHELEALSEDPVSSAEDGVDSAQLAARVHEALHSLKEPYREVFWMRAFGELSFSEIARLHGKTESWARVTYHRARLLIKETIE